MWLGVSPTHKQVGTYSRTIVSSFGTFDATKLLQYSTLLLTGTLIYFTFYNNILQNISQLYDNASDKIR